MPGSQENQRLLEADAGASVPFPHSMPSLALRLCSDLSAPWWLGSCCLHWHQETDRGGAETCRGHTAEGPALSHGHQLSVIQTASGMWHRVTTTAVLQCLTAEKVQPDRTEGTAGNQTGLDGTAGDQEAEQREWSSEASLVTRTKPCPVQGEGDSDPEGHRPCGLQ